MAKKERLDQLVFSRGLVPSRERAKTTIMSGVVFVDGQRADKPGALVDPEADIDVRGPALQYVSRGGLKLEKALKVFNISPAGRVCLDCGASTGGFTDVLLQNGAAKVYAVDVGYGQLAWSLRTDARVVSLERTNARYLTREQVPEEISLAVMDLSFISLRLVLPAVRALLGEGGELSCLIKPQFEAGRDKVGKKGVVREPAVHEEVLRAFLQYAAETDFTVAGLNYSPVRGPEGNIEYLGHLTTGSSAAFEPDIPALVRASHEELE